MNVRPDFGDDTCGLMPHHERRNAAPGSAVIAMNIASADTASFNLDEHILGAHQRLSDVSYVKITRVFEYESLHA